MPPILFELKYWVIEDGNFLGSGKTPCSVADFGFSGCDLRRPVCLSVSCSVQFLFVFVSSAILYVSFGDRV
jgi:hypothetical protein